MNKENLSVDELLKIAKANENGNPDKMLEAVKGRLSDEKKNELSKILSDKKAIETLLSSEKAQALMKKFGQKG
ncbi:MAG: hypothetical protein MJ173_04705 [Clostridia bacterium]|nr:hypothetical protein [Clostridia bacterium]